MSRSPHETATASTDRPRLDSLARATLERAPIGIVYADRQGNYLHCNQTFAAMLGYTQSELAGRSVANVTDPADAGSNATELERLWRSEISSFSREKRYRRCDRSNLVVRETTILLHDPGGTPECSVAFVEDISGRIATEHVLEAVVAEVPVAILACDREGRILIHNQAAADLLSISAGDRANAGPSASYPISTEVFLADGVTAVPRDSRPLARALRGEVVTNLELVSVVADGAKRTTLCSARQLVGPDGERRGAVVVIQDITERKQSEFELERIHKQLVSASRQAGMAEVATSVLHNVGNVLNSVNVSAHMIAERIRHLRLSGLDQVGPLLTGHSTAIAAFLSTDPRGQQLPAYLTQISAQLREDQRRTLEEVAALQDHIEHIKVAVAMQQSYARIGDVAESTSVAALIEDSLAMNASALTRHGVSVRREIGDVPAIMVDRHRVLQILVNLIRNAKYACDESEQSDKRVIVRAEADGANVRIAVMDNGIGISAGNMAQLFSHGFTTRKSGHGFGLHSAAVAAKELGGALSAHSDGRGCGAVFTLTLPLSPPVKRGGPKL